MPTIKNYMSLVKFSHTIFAMPFAMVGYFYGYLVNGTGMDWKIFGLVIICMVLARNAAMGFNRYLDRDIDKLNARTAVREVPAGIISDHSALRFVIINAALFILATYFINPLCLALAPLTLFIILGYSYTKRFTSLCHLVLGLGLSIAPVGAYIAVTGGIDSAIIWLGLSVLTWVAGFDIIYALQDESFDQANNLFSIPAWLGTKSALAMSNLLHAFTALLMITFCYLVTADHIQLSWLTWLGCIVFIVLLIRQHFLVKPNDYSRINMAFFTTNGIASIVFGLCFVMDALYL